MIDNLMTSNVYYCRGIIVIAGSCLHQVSPAGLAAVTAGADQVFSLCLEETHINMAISKIAAILGTGQVSEIRFASVDRSPHCTQMHYIKHEVERTLPEHVPIRDFVIVNDEVTELSEAAIDLSKSLAKLEKMV